MNNFWIPLQKAQHTGFVKIYEDQQVWSSLFTEFGIDGTIIEPVKAEVTVLPQETGILFRGRISGSLTLPCNRCTKKTPFTLRESFDSFEPFPDDDEKPEGTEVDEAVIRKELHGKGYEINPLALAWQELSLALPVKPLCSDTCIGLCPQCGADLNSGPCQCPQLDGDPRMAALRGLRLKK